MPDLLFDEVVGEHRQDKTDDQGIRQIDRLWILALDDVDEGECWPVEEVEGIADESDPDHRGV